jgi:hypothetical protein
MNCASARNRLLTQPDPAAVPDAAAGHFAACPACQAWHRLLLQVETAVAAAPVPAANGRSRRRVLQLFRNGQSDSGRLKLGPSAAAVVVPAARPSARDRLARWWPAGLVAAAVLVGTVSLVVLGGKSTDTPVADLPPDPFLAKVVAAKVKIDTAESPAARLTLLADLAGSIHDEAKALARVTPDEMESLAGLYEQTVGNDALLEQARLLTDAERKAVLVKVAGQLAQAELEANELRGKVPPPAERPLRRIADAAKASKERLSNLQPGRGA